MGRSPTKQSDSSSRFKTTHFQQWALAVLRTAWDSKADRTWKHTRKTMKLWLDESLEANIAQTQATDSALCL